MGQEKLGGFKNLFIFLLPFFIYLFIAKLLMKFAQTASFRGIIMSTFVLQAQIIGFQTTENLRRLFLQHFQF